MYRYVVIALVFCISVGARAEDFIGTRPLGMGNAYRAIVTGNDAIYLNPAGMASQKSYSIEVEYLITPKFGSKATPTSPKFGATDGPTEHVINASVIDNSISQYFATGVAYTRVQRGKEKTGNRIDVAFGFPLSSGLFLGLDAVYLDFGKKNVNAITVNVGALFRTTFGLSLGVVGYNLTNTADYLEHPISMGAAVMFSPFRTLELAFDFLVNFQKPVDPLRPSADRSVGYSYNVGIEYLLLEQLVVRGGYSYDQTSPYSDAHMVAAGLGYVSQVLTIDFGYRGSPSRNFGHVFGITLRFLLQ
jgi:opacity protein-like surface antigen